jgi:TOMM system kinase/cyclase fusion protein
MPHSLPTVGTVFADVYDVLAEIGVGSFGRVYQARRRSTGQLVALKTLRIDDVAADAAPERQVERFRRETALYADLAHPNIVRLLDAAETADGLLYAVFEYVPGRTLKDVLAVEGALAPREASRLMAQVLDALACAHAHGVVHRDLKPENIMVAQTGARRNAMIVDFGLAGFLADRAGASRLSGTHEMMGTPCYAAPEQLRGEPPSPRADLYSWGLIFLETLTGEPAIVGASPQEVIHRQLGLDPVPVPSSIRDRRLRRLLEATVAKRADRRTARVEDLLDALEESGSARVATPRTGEAERRQVTVVCCGVTFVGGSAGGLDLEELDHLLHVQHAVLDEIASRTGGVVTSVLADRVMLVYGHPQAREDDARRAGRAALQIVAQAARWNQLYAAERDVRLEMRVGVHTGLVIAREEGPSHPSLRDVIGHTPQIAVRLAELAHAGEVLASLDTQHLFRDQLVVEPVGEHHVPETSRPIGVVRLVGTRSAASATLSLDEASPLVGRSREIEHLRSLWGDAQAGTSAAVLVSGDPGMGKSRLVHELRRSVPPDSWLECRCMPENQNTPLRPISDLLTALEASLERLLTRHGFDVAETLPLLAASLGLAGDEPATRPTHTPDRQKELTLDTLVRLLFAVATERPVVLVVEDLHWADPTTLELVKLLVQEVRAPLGPGAPRLVIVLTARPSFTAPWGVGDTPLIHLSGLARPDVETLVRRRVGDAALSPEVLDQVVRNAEGVPLFVEEVVRMLVESAPPPGEELGIPASLRDLLTARLDTLSPGARELAQVAAVLGREFSDDMLRAAASVDVEVVQADLRELIETGIVLQRRSVKWTTYVFKHVLLRDAAYETMVRSTRRGLHRRVAETLRDLFPDVEQQRPELLAHHLEHGGQPARAAQYLKIAGDRTMARGAYVESIRQFERGLACLHAEPHARERWVDELGLAESLGTALIATRGYSAPAVEEAFARASEICDRLGGDVPTRVLYGLWGVRLTRADRDATAALLPRLIEAAERNGDPVSWLFAHGATGVRAFFGGDPRQAHEEFRRSIRWYDTEGYRQFVREYGYDGGLYNFGYLAWSLQQLGAWASAVDVAEQAIAHAERNGSPYGISVALVFRALIARDQGDVATVVRLGDRAIPLATTQKLLYWLGPAACLRGWASLRQGDVELATTQVMQGLELLDVVGQRTTYAYHLAALVEIHLTRGEVDAGLAAVERGLALCATSLDCFYEPELLRLRGELLRRDGRLAAAEADFRRALDLACRRGGRWHELRAATSLARLLDERNQRDAAHGLLLSVYSSFDVTCDTSDLRDARALLAAMG